LVKETDLRLELLGCDTRQCFGERLESAAQP
jgi:hypothetical protein